MWRIDPKTPPARPHGPGEVGGESLTVVEAARVLKGSRATVYRLVTEGNVRAVRVSHAIRIPLTTASTTSGVPKVGRPHWSCRSHRTAPSRRWVASGICRKDYDGPSGPGQAGAPAARVQCAGGARSGRGPSLTMDRAHRQLPTEGLEVNVCLSPGDHRTWVCRMPISWRRSTWARTRSSSTFRSGRHRSRSATCPTPCPPAMARRGLQRRLAQRVSRLTPSGVVAPSRRGAAAS
jgi:excisionase family DNA binding protein